MKALEMIMAWDLKAHRHFRLCLRCGHMNNSEEPIFKRICRCALPVLCPMELAEGRDMKKLQELDQFRHYFKGDEEVI